MKKNIYFVILSSFAIFLKTQTDPVISLFFKEAREQEEKIETFKTPGTFARHCIANIIQYSPVAGIIATYDGNIAISDYNGEMLFHRRHHRPIVTILITQTIIPIFMFSRTMHHWELTPGTPASLYSFERIDSDIVLGESLWEIRSVELPHDNAIDPETIIIFADPQTVTIETGTAPTIQSPNLVLPNIVVQHSIAAIENNLNALGLRCLFKQVEIKREKKPQHLIGLIKKE